MQTSLFHSYHVTLLKTKAKQDKRRGVQTPAVAIKPLASTAWREEMVVGTPCRAEEAPRSRIVDNEIETQSTKWTPLGGFRGPRVTPSCCAPGFICWHWC
jgi:hypothetical protein